MVGFAITTLKKGMKNSPCFILAENWAPEAIEFAKIGLNKTPIELTDKPTSCASEVLKKMGATKDEVLMVAEFAGGLGLSGQACGALAATIWFTTLQWCYENPGKSPSFFRNKAAKQLIKNFKETTNTEMECRKICQQTFATVNEHSAYINGGGCNMIIDLLAES
jgi:hypothetical protein